MDIRYANSASRPCSSRSMSTSRISQRMSSRLAELGSQSLVRNLSLARDINLSSNDYLGLSNDPRLKHALQQAVEQCKSVGATGSRLLSGPHADWDDLETTFTNLAGTQ